MKNLLVILICLTCIISDASAQLGKMQFEDAEVAFSEGKYKEALQLLGEAEKSNKGANPLIIHLRVLSRMELLKADPFQSFDLITASRKDVSDFLKKYEGEAAYEDKYREMYQVSKELKKFPASKQEFDAIVAERKKQDEEAARIKKEEEAAVAGAKKYGKELMEKYQYKPNCTLSELVAMNSAAERLSRTKLGSYNGSYWYSSVKGLGNPYPTGAMMISFYHGSRTQVSGYTYNFISGNAKSVGQDVWDAFSRFKEEIYKKVDKRFIEEKDASNVSFLVPEEGVKINIYYLEYNNWRVAGIGFTEVKK